MTKNRPAEAALRKPYLPQQIDDLEIAFPAHAMALMPAMEDIPAEFKNSSSPWVTFQGVWFAAGLSEHFSFVPAEVNGERLKGPMIVRHLTAIQKSFAPKHEHKMAAVAYLSSLWMEAAIYGPKGAALEDMRTLGDIPLQDWLDHFASSKS